MTSGNELAFLAMIRASEVKRADLDPYAVVFGYGFTITDFSDHPFSLGVWHGVPLDFLGPAYVGKWSTAAGAYQIVHPVWVNLKLHLNLPNFSPESQDIAALELIRETGSMELINAGDIETAIDRCSRIWASLPGSKVGQPTSELEMLTSVYTGNGGTVA